MMSRSFWRLGLASSLSGLPSIQLCIRLLPGPKDKHRKATRLEGSFALFMTLFHCFEPFCRTTAETSTEDYDDYEPLFSLGLRSPRQANSRSVSKKQHWEVQDINCQGIPFTTIPGKPFHIENQPSGSQGAFKLVKSVVALRSTILLLVTTLPFLPF